MYFFAVAAICSPREALEPPPEEPLSELPEELLSEPPEEPP